jgi:endonuclease III
MDRSICEPASRQIASEKEMAPIWTLAPESRTRRVRKICEILQQIYGTPRLGNPKDPVDDLVYILLSNKTAPNVAAHIYVELKSKYADWEDVLRSNVRILERLLEPAGLFKVRSRAIRGSLEKIQVDFGGFDLASLRAKTDSGLQEYLVSLPGVSVKVAKCVMLYAFGRQVLPVDAHVHRICTRLGWTIRKRADQCHDELESLISAQKRAAFHVACIVHGRTICRPTDPQCGRCPIRRHCPASKRGNL